MYVVYSVTQIFGSKIALSLREIYEIYRVVQQVLTFL